MLFHIFFYDDLDVRQLLAINHVVYIQQGELKLSPKSTLQTNKFSILYIKYSIYEIYWNVNRFLCILFNVSYKFACFNQNKTNMFIDENTKIIHIYSDCRPSPCINCAVIEIIECEDCIHPVYSLYDSTSNFSSISIPILSHSSLSCLSHHINAKTNNNLRKNARDSVK